MTPAARRPPTRLPISRQNFIELCDELTVKDEEAFESLFRRIGHSYDWSISYRTIDDHSRATAQQAFLRNLARGEAYQAEAPGLWDVTFQTAVAQAELEARDYPGHYHRIAFHGADRAGARRDHPPRADPELRRAHRPPRRRALPAAVRHDGHARRSSASRCRCWRTPRPRWTRAPASRCAARSVTSPTCCGGVSCGCPPARSSPAAGASSARCPSGSSAPPGEHLYDDELAGKTAFGAREAVVAALRASRRPRGRADPDQADGELLRARREAPRDRHLAPVVHPQRRPRRRPQRRPRRRAARRSTSTRPSCAPATPTGSAASTVTGSSRASASSACRSRSGTPSTPTARPTTTPPSCRPRPTCRSTRRPTRRPATPRTSAACPAASSATPTSSTPGRPRRSPRRSPAAGATPTARGTDPLFEKVFPMDVRPQGHDIIRTWLFSTVVRSHFEHGTVPWTQRRDQRLDPRPRPQEDGQVARQRRHPRGRPQGAQRGCRALLGGERSPRHRRGLRHRPDQGRPSPGDQGAQREQVRPVVRRRRG